MRLISEIGERNVQKFASHSGASASADLPYLCAGEWCDGIRELWLEEFRSFPESGQAII
tara:strand:+ start:231 stop:407 length:177 start_codon:yes stop_codon:yes gene_type:complete